MRAPALALALLLAGAGLAIPPDTPYASSRSSRSSSSHARAARRGGVVGALRSSPCSLLHDVVWGTELPRRRGRRHGALAGAVAIAGLDAGARRGHVARERELLAGAGRGRRAAAHRPRAARRGRPRGLADGRAGAGARRDRRRHPREETRVDRGPRSPCDGGDAPDALAAARADDPASSTRRPASTGSTRSSTALARRACRSR